MRALLFVFAITATITPALAHDEGSHATYLSNASVMVARGDTKILFDAFYADSYGQYALTPNDIRAALMAGEAPYDGVDAIFVSHVHGDHFTAAPTIAYMRQHKDVMLYGSQQVYDAMRKAATGEAAPVMKRVIAVDMTPTDKARNFVADGIEIDVVSIPHAGNRPNIQNYAWRVTLDETTTVIHLGDAGPVPADFERHKEHFAARKTHTAFPPYWFVGHDDGEAILKNIIAADQTVGLHVPARAAGNGDQWRTDAGGDLFTDPGETRDIGED